MVAGLHFAIGCAGGAAMDYVAVVSKDAGKLLGDVGAAVSTACACSRRFFRVPVESC